MEMGHAEVGASGREAVAAVGGDEDDDNCSNSGNDMSCLGGVCWNKHAMHGCVAGVCVVCVGAMQLSCCANRSPGLGAERMHGCCVQAAIS